MDRLTISIVIAAVLLGSATASAQETATEFFAVDLEIGWIATGTKPDPKATDPEATTSRYNGWSAGATVRFKPWVGVTGTVARTWSADEDTRFVHYLVGPRVMTPYWTHAALRAFAHVQFGMIDAQIGSAAPEAGGTAFSARAPQIVIGGGVDMGAFVRLQGGYHRLLSDRLKSHNGSSFILGAVVPLCLRGCGEDSPHGIPIGKILK